MRKTLSVCVLTSLYVSIAYSPLQGTALRLAMVSVSGDGAVTDNESSGEEDDEDDEDGSGSDLEPVAENLNRTYRPFRDTSDKGARGVLCAAGLVYSNAMVYQSPCVRAFLLDARMQGPGSWRGLVGFGTHIRLSLIHI